MPMGKAGLFLGVWLPFFFGDVGEETEEGGEAADADEMLLGGDMLVTTAVVPPLAFVAVAEAMEWIDVVDAPEVKLENVAVGEDKERGFLADAVLVREASFASVLVA